LGELLLKKKPPQTPARKQAWEWIYFCFSRREKAMRENGHGNGYIFSSAAQVFALGGNMKRKKNYYIGYYRGTGVPYRYSRYQVCYT
jgi:hypothetical protein